MLKKVLGLFAVLVCSQLSIAQDYYVDVEYPQSSIYVGEEFTISYKLNLNGNSSYLSNPRFGVELPATPSGLKMIRKGTGSSGFGFNQVITVFSYDVVYVASEPGVYNLGPAKLILNGNKYGSKNISFKVSKAMVPDKFNTKLDFVLHGFVLNESPYIGQTFEIVYKLYSKNPLNSLNLSVEPTFEGFQLVKKRPYSNEPVRVELVNDVKYYTIEVIKYDLISQEVGLKQLPRLEMIAGVEVSTGRQYRDLFGRVRDEKERQSVQVKSNKVKVNCLNVPSPSPKGFTGLVGDVEIEWSLSKTEIEAGEAITFLLKFTGPDASLVQPEKSLNFPSDFEIYSPKIKAITEGKLYEYVVVPRKDGKYSFSPFNYVFFSSSEGEYDSLYMETIDFNIRKRPVSQQLKQSKSGEKKIKKEDIKSVRKDIAGKPIGSIWKRKTSILFMVFLPISLSVLIIFFLEIKARRIREAMKENEEERVLQLFLESISEGAKKSDSLLMLKGSVQELKGIRTSKKSDLERINKLLLEIDNAIYSPQGAEYFEGLKEEFIELVNEGNV